MGYQPDMELPSFYLRRQIYGMFWFENEVLGRVADLLPDNIMFETDYPHPNSLSPGPASFAERPRVMLERAVNGLKTTSYASSSTRMRPSSTTWMFLQTLFPAEALTDPTGRTFECLDKDRRTLEKRSVRGHKTSVT